MKKEQRNMDSFLKEKLDGLEHGYRNDWSVFEEKLERALFFRRLRVGAVVSVFLIFLSIGIFGTSAFIGLGEKAGALITNSKGKVMPAAVAPQIKDANTRKDEIDGSERMEQQSAVAPGPSRSEGLTSESRAGPEVLPKVAEEVKAGKNDGKEKAANLAVLTEKSNPLAQAGAKENTQKVAGKSSLSNRKSVAQNSGSAEGKNTLKTPLKKTNIDKQKSMALAETSFERGEKGQQPAGLPEATAEDEDAADGQPEEAKLKRPALVQALSLEESMKKGAVQELVVRPPLMPVKIEMPTGPYVSPLQEDNPWSVSLNVYPNFTFRKFKVDNAKLTYIHRDFIDATKAAERGGFSLNMGLRVSRRVGPITYINSGIEYINYKTHAEFDFTNFRDAQIDESTGRIQHYTIKESPEHISFNDANVYHYLNIPVSISHQPWATDHIRLNMEAGASFMYFLTARGRTINYQTLEVIDISERDYRNKIGSFSLKVGATYHLSPKFNFGLEPTLMYFTNTIYTEEYPFEVIPYSMGVNLKVQMKLN